MNKLFITLLVACNVVFYVNSFGIGLIKKEAEKPRNERPVEIVERPYERPIERPVYQERVEVAENVVIETDNLCAKINCGVGEKCVFVDNKPTCECIEKCEVPTDQRLMVCSSSNKTYESECHFYRERCWCSREDNKCLDQSVAKDTLDYFGECQDIQECTPEQKNVFPSRIKVWLDEVLTFLNDKKGLDIKKYGHLISLASQMKKNKVEKYWTCGVAFEFCQLDKSHNGVIEIDELRELVAPIKALESCIQPFINECDEDNDTKITDGEWGKCLDLTDDDLKLLRTVCRP